MTTLPNQPTPDGLPPSVNPSDRSRRLPLNAVGPESQSAIAAAIDHYRQTITTLKQSTHLSSEELLDARIARDAIHTLRLESSQPISAALGRQINQLDRQFKREIERFKTAYKQKALKRQMQEAIHKWWWFPEPAAPKPFWMHLDSIWSASSLVFLTFSGGLIADLAARVLSGGLDVWGSSTIIIQSLVTLIIGKSALTTSGQEAVKQWLGQRGFSRRWWDEGSLLVSIGLFAVLLGFQSIVLPEFSKFYKCLGDADYAEVDGLPTCLPGGQRSHMPGAGAANVVRGKAARLSSAEIMYKRALSLNPDYADAHYALGILYEEFQDSDQARDAYEKAVKGGKLEAYDRLAQLALKQDPPDNEKAVTWLSKGLVEAFKTDRRELLYDMTNTLTHLAVSNPAKPSKSLGGKYLDDAVYWLSRGLGLLGETPDETRLYQLRRNFGWVLFRQGEWATANDYFKKAIMLDPLRPDAYCLRAQVQQQQLVWQENIMSDWKQCRTLARPYDPDGEIIDPDQLLWQREADKQLKKFSNTPSHSSKQYAEQPFHPQV
jgi:tetratricopeptide (TPR) repeat protein